MNVKSERITAGWYRVTVNEQVFEIERQDLDESASKGWWHLFVGEGAAREWGECFPTKRRAMEAIRADVA